MAEGFATINGYRLRYRLDGRGEPLVVFGHGLLGSIEQVTDYAPRLDELHEDIRLLTFDARGHGQSAGPLEPSGYTWETLGRDMVALAGEHGGERAIFGGGSMGAASALWVALERPESVSALVLMTPPPLGHPHMREDAEQGALNMLEGLAVAIQQFGLEQTIGMMRSLPGIGNGAGGQFEQWLRAQDPAMFVHAIRGLMRSPYHDPAEYARINVPTLVLAHEGDPLHPVRAAKLVAEAVPGARLAVGDAPGYWRDNPGELLAEIRAFMAGLG